MPTPIGSGISRGSQSWPIPESRAYIAVASILFLHCVLALWQASRESATADEVLHVTGGFFYNRFGDFRIQPENGVLPQRLHGLAATISGAPVPLLEGNIHWKSSDGNGVGYDFFYTTGHDHFPMLLGARILNLVFSIGTGLLVFGWSRRLFGATAGVFSLALFALDPNTLAHAARATSDAAAACLLLASTAAFWWALAAPTTPRLALSAATFGLACTAKHSAVLLLPVFLLLVVAHHRPGCTNVQGRRPGRHLAVLLAHAAGAMGMIWLLYGFRYSAFAPALPPADDWQVRWESLMPALAWKGVVMDWFRQGHLLPEAFLNGFVWVMESTRARSAFLAGDYSVHGWTSFFPLAFAWKTPTAVLAAVGASAIVLPIIWLREPARTLRALQNVTPLVALIGVYSLASLNSNLNIGHRHLLPIYPPLYILLGALVSSRMPWQVPLRAFALGIAMAQLATACLAAPHFLAFFNLPSGGPANGYRLLVDSSLDWGQDLPALKQWLDTNNARPAEQPVFLSYFGSGEPDYYGIRAERLPFANGFKRPQRWYEPRAGIYAISATMLQQVYGSERGPWSLEKEQRYQQMRNFDPSFWAYVHDDAARTQLLQIASPEAWSQTWQSFDSLRFARLCHYLRAREPDSNVGHSILIYRLEQSELDLAIKAPWSQLSEAIAHLGNATIDSAPTERSR